MPPPVAQLAQNERMGQPLPPVTPHLAPAVTLPDKVGVTVGISANPLYSQAELSPQTVPVEAPPAKQVNTLATQVMKSRGQHFLKHTKVEPLVKPATPPPPQVEQPVVQAAEQPVVLPPAPVPSAGVPSVMSQSAPGLLFDPSIIGNVQVVTPVGMVLASRLFFSWNKLKTKKAPALTTQMSSESEKISGTSTPTTSQPVGLTRSDSLAAVIADLNQTLAMTSVSNGEKIIFWKFIQKLPFRHAASISHGIDLIHKWWR